MIWLLNFKYLLFPILPTFISLPFTCFGEFCEPQPQPTWNSDPLGPGRAGLIGGGDYQKYYQKYMDSYGSGGGGGYEKYMSEPCLKRPCYT